MARDLANMKVANERLQQVSENHVLKLLPQHPREVPMCISEIRAHSVPKMDISEKDLQTSL
ncbi:MAG: hypothetical protein ACLSGB_08375 [Dorea sp.]